MGVSAEFVTATIFAVIMVIIGLAAIWTVRWQTYFLLDHQSMSLKFFSFPAKWCCVSLLFPIPALTIFYYIDHDPERCKTLREASVCRVESVELDSLIRPSANGLNPDENDRLDMDNNSCGTAAARLMVSGTPSTSPVNITQKPAADIPDTYRANEGGLLVLRNTTSSCDSTLELNSNVPRTAHEHSATDKHPATDKLSLTDEHFATGGLSVLSGTTFQ